MENWSLSIGGSVLTAPFPDLGAKIQNICELSSSSLSFSKVDKLFKIKLLSPFNSILIFLQWLDLPLILPHAGSLATAKRLWSLDSILAIWIPLGCCLIAQTTSFCNPPMFRKCHQSTWVCFASFRNGSEKKHTRTLSRDKGSNTLEKQHRLTFLSYKDLTLQVTCFVNTAIWMWELDVDGGSGEANPGFWK